MDLFDRLERTRQETLAHFDLADDRLDRTYGPGKWSVRFVLHHVAETEMVLHERIRRIVSEPRQQVLWGFDPYAWAVDYAQMPLAHSSAIFDAVRTANVWQLRRHLEAQGDTPWIHSVTGLRTLRDEAEKVAAHNETHLGHIGLALGQTPAASAV